MIERWDIITIGNLSRNRYWGESDERAYRPAICTCTLITGEGWRLLVDPSLSDAEAMSRELSRRTGIGPEEVTHVFITHGHGDHFAGLEHFAHAQWLAAGGVPEQVNASVGRGRVSGAVLLPSGLEVYHTPGHAQEHYSLGFTWEAQRVVIAGDAAMTRDFFRDRRGYFNSANFEQAARTIDHLGQIADVIVPGHDNYFSVRMQAE